MSESSEPVYLANMFYMYTRYPDLTTTHAIGDLTPEDEHMILEQQQRDRRVWEALRQYRIGSFPKSNKEFERAKANLQEMSSTLESDLVILLIKKDDPSSVDGPCLTLRHGVWKSYPSSDHAVRELYQLRQDERYVDMKIREA